MKVVLLQNVKGTGQIGQVKEVADGYAANYLIPNKLARPAQASDLNRKDNKSKVEKKIGKQKEILKKLYKQLNGYQLDLRMKADQQNHLFGSVSPKLLQQILKEKGFEVPMEVLDFEPIKQLGFQELYLSFGEFGKAKLKIIISKE